MSDRHSDTSRMARQGNEAVVTLIGIGARGVDDGSRRRHLSDCMRLACRVRMTSAVDRRFQRGYPDATTRLPHHDAGRHGPAPARDRRTGAGDAGEVFLERAAAGTPHKGKVLLAVQAHSDDIPLMAAGTVAKLVKEGYTGYLVRATNDDMGDAPGLGTPGTIGENVLGNERDNDEVARALGLKRVFNLNYGNHRMGDVSQNELQCRLIFLIRLVEGGYGDLLGPVGARRGESRSRR